MRETINIEGGPKNVMIVVIKPDAYFKADKIKEMIKNAGINIEKEVSTILPLDFVNKIMYKNIPDEVRFENAKHFSQAPSIILEVSGDANLLGDVLKLTGEKTNPNECDEGTIRNIFGDKLGFDMPGGKKYYRNAIHRGRDEIEVEDDKNKFKMFFLGD